MIAVSRPCVESTLLILVFVAAASAHPQEPVGGRARAALERAEAWLPFYLC